MKKSFSLETAFVIFFTLFLPFSTYAIEKGKPASSAMATTSVQKNITPTNSPEGPALQSFSAEVKLIDPQVIQLEAGGASVKITLKGNNLDKITQIDVIEGGQAVKDIDVKPGQSSPSLRQATLKAGPATKPGSYQVRVVAGAQKIELPLSALKVDVRAASFQPIIAGMKEKMDDSKLPVIEKFETSTPKISSGGYVIFSWSISGQWDSAEISPSGYKIATPTGHDGLPLIQNTNLVLKVRNKYGEVQKQVRVEVASGNTSAKSDGVTFLSADPPNTFKAQGTFLKWHISCFEANCLTTDHSTFVSAEITPDIGNINSASGSVRVIPTKDTTYTLNVYRRMNNGSVIIAESATAGVHLTDNIVVADVKPHIDIFDASSSLGSAKGMVSAITQGMLPRENAVNMVKGEGATLSWDFSNSKFDSAEIQPGIGAITSSRGSITVNPSQNTIYTLKVRNKAGEDGKAVEVDVGLAPKIVEFTCIGVLTASGVIYYKEGTNAQLNWSVDYGWERIEISPEGYLKTRNNLDASTADNGTRVVIPTGTATYTMKVTNSFGSVTKSCQMTPLPRTSISQFSVTPAKIKQGESATLNWVINGLQGATNMLLDDPGNPSRTVDTMTGSRKVKPDKSITYTLQASGVKEDWVQAKAYLTVTLSDPPLLSDVRPAVGNIGTDIDLVGRFESDKDLNTVTFTGSSGVVTTTPKYSTGDRLTITVPSGAVSGYIGIKTTTGQALSPNPFYLPVSITGFSPNAGPVGSEIEILGANFYPTDDSQNIKVIFSGQWASVVTMKGGRLKAIVPQGARSGPIRVFMPGGAADSATSFTVTEK